jgi:HEAT repeat protein
MRPLGEIFWSALPAVRPRERSRALFFTALLTLISAAQTLGLAGSEALLLARLGASRLPLLFIAAAVATVLGSIVYAARVGSSRNDRLLITMLVGTAVTLGVGALAADAGVVAALPLLFCLFYLTQAVFLNHFWTFSGDFFDSLASKRLFPVFTVGASVGGLAGGVGAVLLTRTLGPVSLIWAWAAILALAALLLRAARRPLRRWGPLELEEADETSMEGMLGAARYLRGTAIGRWLVVSSVGMVLAIFVAQYLYSDVFARRFPDPGELATFFGLYLAVTNLIEIALELAVTPWLIRRFGVPTAQLVHPLLMLLSFGGLALNTGVASAVGARMSRELAENAIAQPIRSLVYNALPQRLRGRIRAFLEGIVIYAGMAAAGALLIIVGDPDPRLLAVCGAFAAAAYLLANLRVRREYLRELVDGIRAGRLDFGALGDEVGNLETTGLSDVCLQMMRDEVERPSHSLLRLLPSLAQRGLAEPLVLGVEHSHPAVRETCVDALVSLEDARAPGLLHHAIGDVEPRVRRAALRGLAARVSPGALEAVLESLLEDPDPRVRADAAVLRGDAALSVLEAMLLSEDPEVVTAGLAVAPPALSRLVVRRAADPDARVRAVAIERAGEIDLEVPIPSEELLAALEAKEPDVRGAAVGLIASTRPDAIAAVARALADPAASVRRAAVTALAALGDRGVDAAAPYLRDGREPAVEAAFLVSVNAALPTVRNQMLREELRHRVRQMWYCVIAFQMLPAGDEIAPAFLRASYTDAALRHRRLAIRCLALLENERIIRKVDRALRSGAQRTRADALEVLSNLGDREAAHLLVLIHEAGPLEERRGAADSLLEVPSDPGEILRESAESESRWIRNAAAAVDPTLSENGIGIRTMERLLALKRVPLFANLTLDQLEAIHQLASEVTFLPNEVIVREGEAGNELYVLLEGVVDVYLGWETPQQARLGEIRAIDYMGEMAILDDEPRSATLVAVEHARLLSFEGDSLKDLVLQMPEISFEIFRVLTQRVRVAERRLRERQDQTPAES